MTNYHTVLVHLGTNDILAHTPDDILENYNSMVKVIRSCNRCSCKKKWVGSVDQAVLVEACVIMPNRKETIYPLIFLSAFQILFRRTRNAQISNNEDSDDS